MTTIKNIVLEDTFLTRNIALKAPDPFGLDNLDWSGEYDLRIDVIKDTVTKAIFGGAVKDDGFQSVRIPDDAKKYTGAEVAAMINDYHNLLVRLHDAKTQWIERKQYDAQDTPGLSYRNLLESCLN